MPDLVVLEVSRLVMPRCRGSTVSMVHYQTVLVVMLPQH